jgi:hypothetical protein
VYSGRWVLTFWRTMLCLSEALAVSFKTTQCCNPEDHGYKMSERKDM